MNPLHDDALSAAVRARLDGLHVPEFDLARIDALHTERAERRPGRTRGWQYAVAAAAAVLLVVLAGFTYQVGALGLSHEQRINESIAHVLRMFGMHGPIENHFERVESFEGLSLARMQRDAGFRLIVPAGVPARFHKKTINAELHDPRGVSVQWLYLADAKDPTGDHILVIEHRKGHLFDPATKPPTKRADVVLIEYNDDGSLKSAKHSTIDPARIAVRTFTIGTTEVRVSIAATHPTDVADAVETAMRSR